MKESKEHWSETVVSGISIVGSCACRRGSTDNGPLGVGDRLQPKREFLRHVPLIEGHLNEVNAMRVSWPSLDVIGELSDRS